MATARNRRRVPGGEADRNLAARLAAENTSNLQDAEAILFAAERPENIQRSGSVSQAVLDLTGGPGPDGARLPK